MAWWQALPHPTSASLPPPQFCCHLTTPAGSAVFTETTLKFVDYENIYGQKKKLQNYQACIQCFILYFAGLYIAGDPSILFSSHDIEE